MIYDITSSWFKRYLTNGRRIESVNVATNISLGGNQDNSAKGKVYGGSA